MRILSVAALLLASIDPRTTDACATAPPMGEAVRIAEEEALIVWDPATRTEHFIRRAAFHSTTRKFGFLVPTPTIPQLSEVPDSIFWSLANMLRPPVEFDRSETEYEAGMWLFEACALTKGGDKATSAGEPAAVRVLAAANVAGFNATTVEADDATALTAWLGQHGFEATPQLTTWLERYVTDKWKITAFVVATEETRSTAYDIATKAVKMTFPAERPFYPYREPQIEMTVETNAKLVPSSERMLRVFFVSNERYAATLADQPWSAKVLQAGAIPWMSTDLEPVFGAHRYMTVFVDESSPRRGIEELYFAPSTDKADVRQPAQIIRDPQKVTIPIDVIAIGIVIVWFVVRRVRRRARA